MTPEQVLVATAAMAVFCFVVLYRQWSPNIPRVAATPSIILRDVPEVFNHLKLNGKDGSFACFCFSLREAQSNHDAVNIQFSIEHGKIGLDWVLISPINIRDQAEFIQFAKSQGYNPMESEMNNVKYLRIEENKDLPGLCVAVLRNLYRVTDQDRIDLVTDGFK